MGVEGQGLRDSVCGLPVWDLEFRGKGVGCGIQAEGRTLRAQGVG